MEKTYTLAELDAMDSEAIDAETANTYSLEDLDRLDSWSDGSSIFRDTASSFAKGFAADFARIPDEIGSLIKETGEKGGAGMAIPSFNDGVAIARKLTGKDIERGKVDDLFIKAGENISKKNQEFVNRLNLKPEEGSKLSQVMFDLGAGTASIATSLGLLYTTRSPSLLFGLFGARQKGQIYSEARTAGKDPIDASIMSSAAGLIEGGLEGIGGMAWLRSVSFNKFLTRALIRAGEEGLQEGLQQTGEEIVTQFSGIRRDALNDSILRIGYAATLGMVLGAPAGVITSSLEKTRIKAELRGIGLSSSQADSVIQKVTEKTIADGSVKQEIATFLEEEIKNTETALNENPMATKQEELGESGLKSGEDFDEDLAKSIAEEAGVEYLGYRAPFITKSGKILQDDISFNSLETGSTLSLKRGEFTVENIRKKLEDSNKKFGVTTATAEKNDIYSKNFELKQKPQKEGSKIYDKVSGALSKVAEPISTRLKKINPKLKTRLRRYEYDLKQRTLEDEKLVKPFLEAYQKLSPKDQADLDLALKNNDTKKVDEITKRNKMTQEYSDVKDVLGAVYVRAKDTGLDMGFIEDYFPRKVQDVEGMLKFFQKEDTWPEMQKTINKKEESLGRKMSDEEKVEMLNTMLRGFDGKGAKPGNVKKREISQISPELNRFYQDSPQALLNYIYRLNDFIEARRFFGKSVKGTEMSEKTLEDSIGAFVLDLLQSGEISGSQAKEVSDVLKARFAQKSPGEIAQAIRNITYIETMGSVTSAVTQIGDIAFSLYKNGFYRTGKALTETLSGQAQLTKEDIGIERIAEEFSDRSKVAQALDKVFNMIGLHWMDRIGKETTINAALDKYSQLAANPTTQFVQEMENIFGEEAEATIKDLKEKKATDNVKFLLFNELADVQPIALSEMPEAYLKSGNGRLLYMLKTYTIKQIDVLRNEAFLKMRSNPSEGIGNLLRLSALLMLANGTADLIKDLILNRPVEPEDYVIDNFLRLFGVSRYTLFKFKKEGVSQGVSSLVVPPFGDFISSGAKDVEKMLKGEFEPENAEIIQSIPLLGKFYYWWLGAGSEKGKKKVRRKF